MSKDYYYKINENKIIDMVFEDKNLYHANRYLFEAGLASAAIDDTKKQVVSGAKQAGAAVLNFMAFNRICMRVAAALNKNWALKRQTGQTIKDIYQQSIIVLSFFFRSKYKLILIRGFSRFYSWDLAMAIILMYESFKETPGNATRAFSNAGNITPVILKSKILEYYNKIKNKSLTVNATMDVVDGESQRDYGGGIGNKSGASLGSSAINKSEIKVENIASILTNIKSIPEMFPAQLISEFQKVSNKVNPDTEKFNQLIINILEDLRSKNYTKASSAAVKNADELKKALSNSEIVSVINFPPSFKVNEFKFPDDVKITESTNKNFVFDFDEKITDGKNPTRIIIDKNVLQLKIIFAIIMHRLKQIGFKTEITNLIKSLGI